MVLLHSLLRKNPASTVIDGYVTDIYVDRFNSGGYVVIVNKECETVKIPFKKLVASFGCQKIVDEYGFSMFDIVAARGVSSIAMVYLSKVSISAHFRLDINSITPPYQLKTIFVCTHYHLLINSIPSRYQKGKKLPSATVCGATNHITHLAGPVAIVRDNMAVDCYLVKLTCAACITPNIIDKTCADYDAVAAVGLLTAARQTLGCEIEPITVWGCNRQVSRYGQSHWFELQSRSRIELRDRGTYLPSDVLSGAYIQLGAGGGGLTVGPSQPPL